MRISEADAGIVQALAPMVSNPAIAVAEDIVLSEVWKESHVQKKDCFSRVEEGTSSIYKAKTMTLTATAYKYVELDENNVPIIAGTTMKVIELVTGQLTHGWSPEELHFQHPYLTMSQIHSALAYYWDHKAPLDADISQREQYTIRLQQEAGESPLVKKLRAKGLI